MMRIASPKKKTKQLAIEQLPDSKEFFLSAGMYRGKPAIPIVSAGDYVKKYQKIAKADGQFSVNIHSPVSGTVKGVRSQAMLDGTICETIIIENNFKEEEAPELTQAPEHLTASNLAELIFNAGIVGEGGGQFPTHIKYAFATRKIHTFIINGVECEPYLTADYRVLQEQYKALLKIFQLIDSIAKPEVIVLAIERQNKELKQLYQSLAKQTNGRFKVKVVSNDYPQGSEFQLIKAITGRELPRGTIPVDEGILVSNVGTLLAIFNAVATQRPVIDRIVTVSGDYISKYGNYRIKIGTPIQHIIDTLGLQKDAEESEVIVGGPMMGNKPHDFSVAITQGSGGVLFLQPKAKKEYQCIGCGYCIDVCPMHLMPLEFLTAFEKRDKEMMQAFQLQQCIECGACEYICPSNLPLMDSIKRGKKEVLHA